METEKHVVLHIGAGKTGTSALQAAFARNTENLRNRGVLYPTLGENLNEAAKGRISSGNAAHLIYALGRSGNDQQTKHGRHALDAFFEVVKEADEHTILLSSEFLEYISPTEFDNVKKFIESHGRTIQVIYFVRDVGSWLLSAYLQWVKRSGETRGFADIALSGKRVQFCATIRRWQSVPGIAGGFRVYNYEEHVEDLVPFFFQKVLGFGDLDEFDLDVGSVNRSIDNSELTYLLKLNRLSRDGLGTYASDRLIYSTPHAQSQISIPENLRLSLKTRYSEDIEFVNRFIAGKPISVGLEEQGDQDEPDYLETLMKLEAVSFKYAADQFKTVINRLNQSERMIKDLTVKYEAKIDALNQHHQTEIDALNEVIATVVNSRSYKLTAPARKMVHTIRKAKDRIFSRSG